MNSLPWQALKVVCEGVSIVDVPRLDLKSEAEAYQFLKSYGFDLFEPTHVEQVWRIYDEAVEFLEVTFQIPVPPPLKNRAGIGDLRRLLLIASGIEGLPLYEHRSTICATLRVMHALAHFQNDLRLKYLPKIRRQTIDRFEAHLQRIKTNDGREESYLGFERDKVRLIHFDRKEGKNKQSALLKLLQKAESVAQEIYDHVGVRFVTKTKVEAIFVVRYLIQHHLISVANMMSARSRNSLIRVEALRSVLENKKIQNLDEITPEQLAAMDAEIDFPSGASWSDNPFSSSGYHALQFTCRPLIRIPVVRRGGMKAEISFFFPLEVQIMDEKSFQISQEGEAKHSVYKQKQLEAVRTRILKG